jgi:hypothetical protein
MDLPSPTSRASINSKDIKDEHYLSSVMDVLDDSAILSHCEYKFNRHKSPAKYSIMDPASPNNQMTGSPNNNNTDRSGSPDGNPNTGQSNRSSVRSRAWSRAKTLDLTPEEVSWGQEEG